LPGVALKLSGANGMVAGMDVTLADPPAPMAFTARTLKICDVPLVSPVKVWLVMLVAFTHVAPLSRDT